MNRASRRMLLIASLLIPVATMLYLYSNNAQYLDFGQVCILTGLLVVVSAIGYAVFRLLTKSSFSAFIGCVVMWIAFFSFGSVFDRIGERFAGGTITALVYLGLALLLSLVIAFAVRRAQPKVIPPIALSMCVVLLVMNAVPVVNLLISMHSADPGTSYKNTFVIDDELPTPNVYWIHADGMLGFEAFETYFGDDQAAFKASLIEDGFELNETAYMEVGHRTVMAIPALLSPYFYDNNMAERCATNESALEAAWDASFLNNGLQEARTYSETRLAFEERGYMSQTMGEFSIFFPPVSDRFYATIREEGCYIIDFGENPAETYMSFVQAGELFEMLTRFNFTRSLVQAIPTLSKYSVFDVERRAPEHTLDQAEVQRILMGSKAAARFGYVFEALYDAMYSPDPTYNVIYFMPAHSPFVSDEMGQRTGKEPLDLMNYPDQHRYAAKLLQEMVDMIIEKNPDAVIVIQADHGLHLQTREMIEEKLGEAAVLPLWNQVTSAIRVPEKYKNGAEARATENPLNMARYLVNRFVGENYDYLAPDPGQESSR